jgi:hypothetical protein
MTTDSPVERHKLTPMTISVQQPPEDRPWTVVNAKRATCCMYCINGIRVRS